MTKRGLPLSTPRTLIALGVLATLTACQRPRDGLFVGVWKKEARYTAGPNRTPRASSRDLELNLGPNHTFQLDVPTLDVAGPESKGDHISLSTVKGTWDLANGRVLFNTSSLAGASLANARQEEVDFETRVEQSRHLAERLDTSANSKPRTLQSGADSHQNRPIYSFIDLQIPVMADLSADDNRLTMSFKSPDAIPINLARAGDAQSRN